eukprot:186136-Chlamydomonas_euryale.AAC.2
MKDFTECMLIRPPLHPGRSTRAQTAACGPRLLPAAPGCCVRAQAAAYAPKMLLACAVDARASRLMRRRPLCKWELNLQALAPTPFPSSAPCTNGDQCMLSCN